MCGTILYVLGMLRFLVFAYKISSALLSSDLNGPKHLNVFVKRNAAASSELPFTLHQHPLLSHRRPRRVKKQAKGHFSLPP